MGARHPYSGAHACLASTLLIAPTLQPSSTALFTWIKANTHLMYQKEKKMSEHCWVGCPKNPVHMKLLRAKEERKLHPRVGQFWICHHMQASVRVCNSQRTCADHFLLHQATHPLSSVGGYFTSCFKSRDVHCSLSHVVASFSLSSSHL